eukprot:6203000-Pleurochrysis_carterae.AAC.1
MFPGGSKKQKTALERGEAYKLAAWLHPAMVPHSKESIYANLCSALRYIVGGGTRRCVRRRLAAVRPKHRLEATGFTKNTVAIYNPTPVHSY